MAHYEDERSPVMPDSTTEPKPLSKRSKMFQEGDDVFFRTNDDQLILGTVGQIVGQTCQVLFGDGTQEWASFKRIKKLSGSFDDEDDSISHTKETDAAMPSTSSKKGQAKQSIGVPQKEETIDMYCSVCGVKKKITISKARMFKPEGPHVFKCKKCNKESSGIASKSNRVMTGSYNSSTGPSPTTPKKSISSVIANSITKSLPSTKSITIPTASGSISVFRKAPASVESTALCNATRIVRSFGSSQSPSPNVTRKKPNMCFSCEKETGLDDCIPCNLCRRPCHLLCLPLSYPPPRGDRFWDLMCTSCGTQNNDVSSRSRVFSVRRNLSCWSDVAYLVITCKRVEHPSLLVFELDSDILQFLEQNIDKLHLPRQFKLPTAVDRKKFILHALYNSQNHFVNGKEMKKRSCYWGLRKDMDKKYEQSSNSSTMPAPVTHALFKNDALNSMAQSQALTIRVIPPPARSNENTDERSTINRNLFSVKNDSSFDGATVRIDNHRFTELNRCLNQPGPSGSFSSQTQMHAGSMCIDDSISNKNLPINLKKTSRQHAGDSRQSLKRPLEYSPAKRHELTDEAGSSIMNSSASSASKRQKLRMSPSPAKLRKVLPLCSEDISPSPVKKTATSQPSRAQQSEGCKKSRHSLDAKLQTKNVKVKVDQAFQEVYKADKTFAIKTSPVVAAPAPKIKVDKSDKVFAIKTSPVVPAPAPKIKELLKLREGLKSNLSSPESEKSSKSKFKKSSLKGNLLKSSSVALAKAKLRIRNQERTLRAKKPVLNKKLEGLKSKSASTSRPKLAPLRLTRTVNGIQVSKVVNCTQQQQMTTKKVVEKDNKIADSEDAKTNLLKSTNASLMDAILYGNYRVQCLPSSPTSEAEKRSDLLKVYGHFRTEKQNETASLLLGRSETETRSQTRRKSELFGRRKRDLNDFESYDVVAKRVDENGLTQYFVVWKSEDDEAESESDVEQDEDTDDNFMEYEEKDPKFPTEVNEDLQEIPTVKHSNGDYSILRTELVDLTMDSS